MALRIYNTLAKRKEIFEPVEPGKVGIYLCGPTVYKESHIGHAVGPVIFDAFKKFLTYKGYKVKLVVNITDVDDKLIVESQRLGISIQQLAQQVSASYFEAMEKLGVTSVDVYPRATEHIEQITRLIQRLGENDAAYEVAGDVYFDISRCKDYGRLSHRRSEDQLEGSRQLQGEGKRNSGDFALWKKSSPQEIGWDSPWGRGRPGWHIECSAMSMHYLGETFDIHGGGMDLIFPHHENEIAQAQTATGKPFVKYWMHNGLTRLRTKAAGGDWQNEKMSKSLGNIRPISELLEIYPPPCIRFFLLSTHYRRPIDFSDEAIQAVQKGMMNIYRLLDRAMRLSSQDVYGPACRVNRLEQLAQSEVEKQLKEAVTAGQIRYLEALDDDFNTAGALAVLFELCSTVNRFIDQQQMEIKAKESSRELLLESARMVTTLGQILGLLDGPIEKSEGGSELTGKMMQVILELRTQARKEKNFTLADSIRDRLKELDIVIEDRPDGSVDWRKE